MNIYSVVLKPIINTPSKKVNPTLNISSAPSQGACIFPMGYSPAYFHPSFCASNEDDKSMEKFSKMLDFALKNPIKGEKMMKDRGEEFFKKVFTTAMKKKPIGEGKQGTVYKLDEKYVFKIKNKDSLDFCIFEVNQENKFNDLKLWYGKEVASVGNISILKNANPYGKAITAGSAPDESEKNCRSFYNKTYLPKCSSLSQKAFDDLAFDFKALNNVGKDDYRYYEFDDENPNNFIIGEDSIKIVDDLYFNRFRNPNTLAEMSKVLINKYRYRLYAQPEKSSKILEMQKEILKKCILASERAELPICSAADDEVNRAFELCGHSEKWRNFRRQLLCFRENIPNMEYRIEKIAEEFDKLDNLT